MNTYGVFATDDEVTNLLLPGPLGSRTHLLEQRNKSFVGRYTRGFGDSSTIGALVTKRSGNGYRNDVAGIDGRYRINDTHSIRYQYLESTTDYPVDIALQLAQPDEPFDGQAFRVDYELDSREWGLEISHRDFDAGFRADAGFVTRVGVEQQFVELSRIWHGDGEEQWWNRLILGVNAEQAHDSAGQLLIRDLEPLFSFEGPLQSFFQIGTGRREEYWEGQVFHMRRRFMYGQLRPRSGLSIVLSATVGDQLDYANAQVGDRVRLQPQIDWNVNKHLLVRLRHTSDRLKNDAGATVFDAALTDLRLTWQFNLRSFVRLTLQRQEIDRNVALYRLQTTSPRSSTLASQLLYSYKLNPQTVFFAGYSDNWLEHDLVSGLERTDRTLFFKLGYAWAP